MEEIIKILKEKLDIIHGKRATEASIRKAELTLGLNFSSDYRDYLLHFGIAAFNGHEFTGINPSSHLDVSELTIRERQENKRVPSDMYVIEMAIIDDIIVWQSSEGPIYQTSMGSNPVKVYDSLVAYIKD